DRASRLVDHRAVADLVLDLAESMNSRSGSAHAQLRLLGHLDLGDQAARGRVPSREVDAGRLADEAAPAVAPDEVRCTQRPAVGQRDVDAGIVLREAGDLDAKMDRHVELAHPARHDALDVILPQTEAI